MVIASIKNSHKAIPALDIYQQQACTLTAFKNALHHGIANKEKELAKTFQKQLFQAAGLDKYRLHLNSDNDLTAILNLALAVVNKQNKPDEWLQILEQPDYWNAVKLTSISNLLNKAVKRLATHIPKVRNPGNEGAPRFLKSVCNDPAAISASEASLASTTIEGDATLVGARFFFEFVFYLDKKPSSVLELLLNKDTRLTAFLSHCGMDENTLNVWYSVIQQNPKHLSPLQAQLLFDVNHKKISITPMFSVAASSWLGQWRKEQLASGDSILEGTRPLFAIESAEYGGTNARNIAAILMDFSGRQHHPKVQQPPVKRGDLQRLIRLVHRPDSLINPKKLGVKSLNELRQDYLELPNESLTEKLDTVIANLLEDLLMDIFHICDLIGDDSPDAAFFQNLPDKHPYLRFALGTASEQDISRIAHNIVLNWLGILEESGIKADRYHKIIELVTTQLQNYSLMEFEL